MMSAMIDAVRRMVQASVALIVFFFSFGCTSEKNEGGPGNLELKTPSKHSLNRSANQLGRYGNDAVDKSVESAIHENGTPCFVKRGDEGVCNKWFGALYPYSKLEFVGDSALSICDAMVDTLCYYGCSDHLSGESRNDSVDYTLTLLYGIICLKSNSAKGVASFMNYLIRNENSAEEQLSFSFENIFVHRPRTVLEQIHRKHTGKREYLLGHLAWGFLNNRYYGITASNNGNSSAATADSVNEPRPVLGSSNYKEIFFSLNPEIRSLYGTYPGLINDLLSEIGKELATSEEIENKEKQLR